MKIIKQIGLEEYEIMGDSGKAYKVTTKSCNCPRFIIALRGKGICKHIDFLKKELDKSEPKLDTNKILQYIKDNGKVYHQDLENVFGNVDKQIRKLSERGDIYESKPGQYQIL